MGYDGRPRRFLVDPNLFLVDIMDEHQWLTVWNVKDRGIQKIERVKNNIECKRSWNTKDRTCEE